jgi:hypothetical protein
MRRSSRARKYRSGGRVWWRGEITAQLLLALKHSDKITGIVATRAGRVVHGLRLCDVHQQTRCLFRDRWTGCVQSLLRPSRRHIRLLPRCGDLGLRGHGVGGTRVAQRNLGPEQHARFISLGSATTSNWRKARTSARRVRSGPWPVMSMERSDRRWPTRIDAPLGLRLTFGLAIRSSRNSPPG